MAWHYGIIRKKTKFKDEPYIYQIHEIFRFDGKYNWTKDPITPGWDNVKDLKEELRMMTDDLNHYPIYEVIHKKLVAVKRGNDAKKK